MTPLPPLRLGICTIGPTRYPAIVGKVVGEDREMFICGVHIDRFVAGLLCDGVVKPSWQVTVNVEANGKEL